MMRIAGDSSEQRAERTALLAAELEALPPKIEQIVALSVGVNSLDLPGNWDLVLTVDVADEEALNSYRTHPEHLKVVALMQHGVADRCAVDFFL